MTEDRSEQHNSKTKIKRVCKKLVYALFLSGTVIVTDQRAHSLQNPVVIPYNASQYDESENAIKGWLNKPVGAFIVHLFCYSIAIKETRHAGEPVTIARRVANMKGYTTAQGYMGYVDGSYMLFASEDDYLEYVEG